MSSDSSGTAVPVDGDTIAVAALAAPATAPADAADVSKSTGLYSPPDSNNAVKLDGSDDSELSDLDEALAEELSLENPEPEPEPQSSPQSSQVQPEPAAYDDIGDIEPDHYSGTVPVFRPTMDQFKDFKKFMEKVDKYGMKTGIVKVIPPKEWKDSQPALNDLVKTVRVREPIKQDIMGSNGTYRQVNILHQRSYNLPQWRQLCEQSEHQPPARRGERRANADKPKPPPKPRAGASTGATATNNPTPRAAGSRRGKRGRPFGKKKKATAKRAPDEEKPADGEEEEQLPPPPQPQSQPQPQRPGDREDADEADGDGEPEAELLLHPEAARPDARPMTPESAKDLDEVARKPDEEAVVIPSIEEDPGVKEEDDDDDVCDAPRLPGRMGFTRQAVAKTQSTSARRKYAKREASAKIDEAAFKDWDYRMDVSDFSPERCEELERIYWKTLTYAPPLYGADLAGTLFDDSTTAWNLNKLPNLLDVLGTKVPGVNTAYLYLGMWKATFAWHLEDVDLYSINYLHFGAPKQWYSISQGDARRFEAAMKNIWPDEAKACDQFLRHKAFLISPSHLLQHYNIRVNKCLSYPGEFVVTYPYGYHSGYNLGYNCAEAVNFALDSWLPMGKIAKRCECAQAQDSVWINVYEIERKLRGESTEYEETEDDDDDDILEEEDEDNLLADADASTAVGFPTPPSSHTARVNIRIRKRKRPNKDGGARGGRGGGGADDQSQQPARKKIRLRLRVKKEPSCCLCVNDIPGAELLPTDDGRRAHRVCALYLPETYIETAEAGGDGGDEIVTNAANIAKARLELRCQYCRSKLGACFQCGQRKCARAYHATCAAAAGVLVEEADVPVVGEDGTEYKERAFGFLCRYHRTKRDRKLDGDALERSAHIRDAADALRPGQTCQLQYYRGDIFAGLVVENRRDEQTLLVDVLPRARDRVEVEWKWLLLPDPADLRLPKASPTALPMPASRKAQDLINATKRAAARDDRPQPDDAFVDGYTWAEFRVAAPHECHNPDQARVDLTEPDRLWHYLYQGSTVTRAHYTEDPAKPAHNPNADFLKTLPRPPPPAKRPRQSNLGPPADGDKPEAANNDANRPDATAAKQERPLVFKPQKPYVYKPRKPAEPAAGYAAPLASSSSSSALNPLQLSSEAQALLRDAARLQAERLSASPAGARKLLMARLSASHGGAAALPGQFPPLPAAPQPLAASSAGPRPPLQAPAPGQSMALAAAPKPKSQPSTFQKYAFFQVNHNRDSTAYRTPYAPWGGFTNGYEGDLRAHLLNLHGASLHKHGGSFGLGGGLKGLIRPSPHTNYNSPPSSSSSTTPSPYVTDHSAGSSGAAAAAAAVSSASSFASYDAMQRAGAKLSQHSPIQPHLSPFAGSPVSAVDGFEVPRQAESAALRAAAMPSPFSALWAQEQHQQHLQHQQHQQAYSASLGRYAQGGDVGFSHSSPMAAGMLAASPIIKSEGITFSYDFTATASPPLPPHLLPAPPPPPPPPFHGDCYSPTAPDTDTPPARDTDARETPAEQLKQQLRRISDPPLPSSYSVPHPAVDKKKAIDMAAHAPVSPQIPAPMSASAAEAPPEPQQSKPHLHQPAPRPQLDLKNFQSTSSSPPPPPHPRPPRVQQSPVSTIPIRDAIPGENPDSNVLLERMMVNLRKASEMYKQLGEKHQG